MRAADILFAHLVRFVRDRAAWHRDRAAEAIAYRDEHVPEQLGYMRGQFWADAESIKAEAWEWLGGLT